MCCVPQNLIVLGLRLLSRRHFFQSIFVVQPAQERTLMVKKLVMVTALSNNSLLSARR